MGLHDDDSSAKSQGAPPAAVPPVSLTPDRRRIDSDVRCFLRQPSTPWITFQDGDVFTSPASSILTSQAVFPKDPPGAPEPPKQEPSSLAVAADLGIPVGGHAAGDLFESDAEQRILPAKRSSRVVVGAAAAIALVGLVAVIGFGMKSTDEAARSHRAPHSAYASQPGASGADITPPNLDPPPPAPEPAATAAATTPDPRSRATRASTPGKEEYGRLSIAGKARASFVFLDGKRLLGKGARGFTVVCGPHQIAVGERTNVRDVDVPCNAELVISE